MRLLYLVVGAVSLSGAQVAAAEQQTATATEAFSTRTPTVSVGLPIEIDPTNRSACSFKTPAGRPIELSLEGMKWKNWSKLCDKLAKYLRADELPGDLAENSQKLLADTGFFLAVTCTATTAEQNALRCA